MPWRIPSREGRDRCRPHARLWLGAPPGQGGETAFSPMGAAGRGATGGRAAIDLIYAIWYNFSSLPPWMAQRKLRGGTRASVVELWPNKRSSEDLPQVRIESGKMRSPHPSGAR
jgi:hypothetical protein